MATIHEITEKADNMSKWEELKRLAEAATPGPWKSQLSSVKKGGRNIASHIHAGESLPIGEDVKRGQANAAYIAAANPAAILDLIAERDALAADAARYRWLRNEAHPDYGPAVAEHRQNDWGKWYYTFPSDAELDAAIDAAMKGE